MIRLRWMRRLGATASLVATALAGCSLGSAPGPPTEDLPPGCAAATGWVDRVEAGIIVIVDGEGEEMYCPHREHLRWAREGVFLRRGLVDMLETRRLEAEIQRTLAEIRAASGGRP